jgi:hypothetical protein
MRTVLAAFAAVLCMAFSTTGASAQQCSLASFDKEPPKSVKDTTPKTNDSEFEWGSDVDPWDGDARGWHYIKNLHSKRLSLEWKKPAIVIPFDKPLEAGGIFCKTDYGSLKSYELDKDAPIRVSNDGMKAAQAYVQVKSKQDDARPSITGAALRRTYSAASGEIAAFARIVLRYYAATKQLQVDFASGPEETRVGLAFEALGIPQETFFSKLRSNDFDFKGPFALKQFVRENEISSIGAKPEQNLVLVRANRQRSLTFEDISVAPSGDAPMVLIGPDGAALALTNIRLDQLSGAR